MSRFEIVIVDDSVSPLTSSQQELVNYFKGKTKGCRIAKRADINPSELTKYLPHVYIADYKKNSEGVLIDTKFRVMGTALATFYGEHTGEWLMSDENEDSFKYTFPDSYERMLLSFDAIITQKKPMKIYSEVMSEEKNFIGLNSIMFPLSENGKDISGIFAFIGFPKNNKIT